MLLRSTILFILLSIQLLLAAPITYFPNTELEPRGEHRPTLIDYPLHPYTKPDVNHYEHEVKVEPRQILDLVKLGVEVGTNKNVQSVVKQGVQTAVKQLPTAIKKANTVVSKAVNTVKNVGSKAVNAVKNAGSKAVNAVKNVGNKIGNAVKNVGSKIGGFFGRLFGHHK